MLSSQCPGVGAGVCTALASQHRKSLPKERSGSQSWPALIFMPSSLLDVLNARIGGNEI